MTNKIFDELQNFLNKHIKLIILLLFLIFIIAIAYSLYLCFFVTRSERLEYLGEFIGVPSSILITALFSNYEFKRNTKYKNLRLLLSNLYKINMGLSSIRLTARAIAGIYSKSMPKRILANGCLSSVSQLSDSSEVNVISININTLKEKIYINSELRSKLFNSIKSLQNKYNYITDEIGYIGNYKNASLKVKEKYRQYVYNACFVVMSKSDELIQSFNNLQNDIYNMYD